MYMVGSITYIIDLTVLLEKLVRNLVRGHHHHIGRKTYTAAAAGYGLLRVSPNRSVRCRLQL